MRGIVGYIVFFTCGLLAAGAYFYQLHPEHSIDEDLPRMRREVDDVVDRGKRLREAWDRPAKGDDKPTESTTGK